MTRRTLMLALTIVAGTITSAAAQAPAAYADAAKAADTVKSLDAQRFEATTKNDLDALGKFLADDLVYVHSSAVVDNKSNYIEALRSGKTRYVSIEPSEVKVRVYGNTAIVNGFAKLTVNSDGKSNNMSLRYTDVWVLRDNRWQMVSWHSTRLPQPPPQ